MRKKGQLLKNLVGIIIAVIGLSVLFLGFYKLYTVSSSQESENARNLLSNLVTKIETVDQGEGKMTFQGFNGADTWYLVGWSKNDDSRPQKCLQGSCLCVCKFSESYKGDFFVKNCIPQPEICQEKGFCRNIEVNEITVSSIGKYDQEDELNGDPGAGGATIQTGFVDFNSECLILRKNLFELNVSKDNSKLFISHDVGIVEK